MYFKKYAQKIFLGLGGFEPATFWVVRNIFTYRKIASDGDGGGGNGGGSGGNGGGSSVSGGDGGDGDNIIINDVDAGGGTNGANSAFLYTMYRFISNLIGKRFIIFIKDIFLIFWSKKVSQFG